MRVKMLARTALAVFVAYQFISLSVSTATADETTKAQDAAGSDGAPAAMVVPDFVESGNPMSRDAEAISAGLSLYNRWCNQCHGPSANGDAPRFGEGYAGDLTKFWRGYGEYVAIVLNGRPKKQMPPWKEYLSVEQISQIGAWLETLAVEGANWK